MDKRRLKTIPLFDSLKRKELERVAQCADEVDVAEGKVIANQGDSALEFFVIEKGHAAVTVDGDPVAELGPGDFFGEIALIEHTKRTATVQARSPMTLIVMTRSSFRSLERDHPAVAAQLRDAVGHRVARSVPSSA